MAKSGQRGTGPTPLPDENDAGGALSALLGELARSPEAEGSWDRTLRPGAVVGRFELVREIGRGGFGVVWEARDRELGRAVAFKAVRAGERGGLREERLLREAEAAARLAHPNIVTLYDAGRCEQGPYLVLELLRGETLADRLAQGPVPQHEAVRIAAEVAAGLAHAHREGVVHRDLSPGNVFLCEDGQVKVLDFGLAHAFGRRRVDGGTPAYMAPEQWRGAPEDERTDVFALGVILYRMLSGDPPFPADDGGKTATGSRAAPALETPDVPALGAFVGRMLAKDPVARPRDGAEVHSALVAFRRELERTPNAGASPVRARRAPRLRFAAAAAAVVVAVAGAAALGVHLRGGAEPAPAAAEGRITVAVADFVNQTGEAELNGLSGMLITSLEQSRRLAVLTRVRMLDILRQLGRENVATVDEPLGREVALSAGVRALVLASIRRFDERYAIELKALDPHTSEYLFTLKEVGKGKASIPDLIDRLSEQTRAALRETPAEVRASRVAVADATTSSFEAYAHYFRGEQHKDATRYEPALDAYRQAIAADPTFALAHYQIAYLGEFTSIDTATRQREIEAALREVSRVPDKERLLILAWKAHMDGDAAQAHALYARAVEAYPQDKEALYMAGDLHFHADEFAEALPLFEKALALDPLWEPALMHFTDCLAKLGKTDELVAKARWWVERAPTASSYRALTWANELSGKRKEAVDAARRALELDGTHFSRVALADALDLEGRFSESEAVLRQADGPAWKVAPSLAATLAYQGRFREALRAVEGMPADGAPGHDRDLLRLLVLVASGRLDAARPIAATLKSTSSKWPPLPSLLVLLGQPDLAAERARDLKPGGDRALYEAAVAWRAGDKARALGILRPVTEQGERAPRSAALWVLAEVALDAGDDAAAVAALRRFRGIATGPGNVFRAASWGRSLYLEAAALERMGERAKARERLDELLAAWQRADPDEPILAKARALRRRVA